MVAAADVVGASRHSSFDTPIRKPSTNRRLDGFNSIVKSLRAAKTNIDLIADVDIFAKAGTWLMEIPARHRQRPVPSPTTSRFSIRVSSAATSCRRASRHGSLKKAARFSATTRSSTAQSSRWASRSPTVTSATKPDRLYVWLHGRTAGLSEASFIVCFKNAPQFPSTAYTADVGQLTLDCYGRGNNANHRAGEVDIFEGITAGQRISKIDPERILLRGFSLGGAAAWHIALQYPDRWAAAEVGAGTYPGRLLYAANPFPPYQDGPLHIYENIIDWALNAYNLPLAGYDGDADDQVATVGAPRGSAPMPNRGQLESSLRVRAQLAKEGFPSENTPTPGMEGNWTVPGTRDIFMISTGTKHGVNREVKPRSMHS